MGGVVRIEIDPDSITEPDLLDRLVDFTERTRSLIDWGRRVEGSLPATPDRPSS